MKVLILEDDAVTSSFLAKALSEAGHVVDEVDDGADGLARAMHQPYDALIVDRMLPSLDGLTVIETLRRSGKEMPVLILSALSDVDERVRGLRAGGDDYLVKPFAFAELLARLEILARRKSGGPGAPQTRLVVGDLELERMSREVRRGGREIALQNREYQILEYLMRHTGQVVTRTMLLESVWGYHFDPQTNVIDVHVSRLRRKLDDAGGAQLIHTVRGAGYVLREPS